MPVLLPALNLVGIPAFFAQFGALITVLLGVAFFRVVVKIATLVFGGTFTLFGFDGALSLVRSALVDSLSGLPDNVLQLLLLLRLDDSITIILSGYCLLYTSPSPRDATLSRMPSSA